MTAETLVARLEARGLRLVRRGEIVAVRPAGQLATDERAAMRRLRPEVVSLLRGRALGTDWARVSLYHLDKVLEIEIPGWEVRMILAPGCRIARELRATDPKPGRIWCSCEVSDLLLSGVTPEDARKFAEARLTFDATLDGVTRERASSEEASLQDEKGGRS